MNTLVFDIETVPDVEFGRRLFGLEGLSDDEVGKAMQARARQESGSDFLPHEQHRIVAISCAFRSREGFRVWSLGDESATERELVERFFDGIDKFSPELVSWNGGGFDLPVLHYRALRFQVAAPRYWETGDDDNAFRYNNYLGRFHWRHIDVMDVLSGYQARARASLSDTAVLLGYPGKLGFDGSQVWDAYRAGELTRIRRYCETDVINTWLDLPALPAHARPADGRGRSPKSWRAPAPGSPTPDNRTSTSSSPPGARLSERRVARGQRRSRDRCGARSHARGRRRGARTRGGRQDRIRRGRLAGRTHQFPAPQLSQESRRSRVARSARGIARRA